MLGLDLGCTTCSVAVHRQGVVNLVANEQGSRKTPSVIAFTEAETLLGEPAKGQLVRNASNTIVDGVRLLGRHYEDPAFQSELESWKFNVGRGKDGAPVVEVMLKGEKKSFAAPRLLSLLLSQLRADAEAATGEAVKEAVVAMPADFDAQQRAALKEAAQIGGIRVKLMLSAPLCVALLYGQTVGRATSAASIAATTATTITPATQQLLVIDVGGTLSSVAVIELRTRAPTEDAQMTPAAPGERSEAGLRTASDEYTVRACTHERGCAGTQVDELLRAHVVREIRRRQRVDLREDKRAMSRLLAACQQAKCSLTTSAQATITVEADGVDYFTTVSRAALEEMSAGVATAVGVLTGRALAIAGLSATQVDAVLLAGGGARMLRVQAAVAALCPQAAVHFGAVAEETVSRGAAHAGALLRQSKATMTVEMPASQITAHAALAVCPRLPRALGVRTSGGGVVTLIHANAALPFCAEASLPLPASEQLPLLLQVLELPPRGSASSDYASIRVEQCRAVASLAIRSLPASAADLQVRLNIDESKRVQLEVGAMLSADAETAPYCGDGHSSQWTSLALVNA